MADGACLAFRKVARIGSPREHLAGVDQMVIDPIPPHPRGQRPLDLCHRIVHLHRLDRTAWGSIQNSGTVVCRCSSFAVLVEDPLQYFALFVLHLQCRAGFAAPPRREITDNAAAQHDLAALGGFLQWRSGHAVNDPSHRATAFGTAWCLGFFLHHLSVPQRASLRGRSARCRLLLATKGRNACRNRSQLRLVL